MKVRRYLLQQWIEGIQSGFDRFSLNSLKGFVSLFLVGAALSVVVAACGPGNQTASNSASPAGGASPVTAQKQDVALTLVSFAVTKEAYSGIISKFVEKWQKERNQTVKINESYGGSSSQTRAVIDGLEADIVHLALALDTDRIAKAGLIESG
jgi:sulfate transport system substrate-binding protein